MESKKINQLATELAPELSDLTIIGDPTTGISKKITLSQMASLFTGTVEEYANLASFPLVGTADTIYIALDTNIIYRWNTGTSAYVELSPNIVTSLVFSDANGFDGTISLVGSTATLTITTALTTGSVPFIGASGALSQDNANLFFDDTNNRLGINTNTPTTALDVFGSGIIGRLNGTSTNNAFLGFASAGTNKWSIGNVQSDHRFRIYNEATTSELVSVLQTGEFGIGIANPTTKFHIDGGASALIANLDADVSIAKSISFRSDNSNRINLEVSGTESGSNAGANFFIRRYSDAGALIDTPLTITRSTGNATFLNSLTTNSTFFVQNTDYNSGTATGTNFRISLNASSGNTYARLQTYTDGGGTYGNIALNALGGRIGIGTTTMGFAKLYVYNDTNDSTYNSKIQAVFGNAEYQDSDAIQNYGSGTSETQFLVGNTGRPAMLSLGGNINTGEAVGVLNFFRSTNTDTYRSRAWIWAGINTTGTANQHGGFLAFSTANDGQTNPQERFRIASTGVATFSSTSGIGLTIQADWNRSATNDSQLYIKGSTNGNKQLRIGYDTTGNVGYIQALTSGSSVDNLLLNPSGGNILIGTSTAVASLSLVASTVNSQISTGSIEIQSYALNNAWIGDNIYFNGSNFIARQTGYTSQIYFESNGQINFKTNNGTTTAGSAVSLGDRMIVTSGGDICMGTGSASAGSRLSVVKSSSDYVLYVQNTNNTSGDKTYRSILGSNTNNTNSFHFSGNAASGDRIYIYGNGNIVNSNNSYGPLSDIKLKENIVDATPKLEKLMQVRIVNYNLIDTPELKQIGVIAQELEQIFPALIDEHPDFDIEGNNLGTTTKSVKMSVFVPMLIKAMQEQQAQIEELKALINK